jgi:putative alpha-1,2-mannosidase
MVRAKDATVERIHWLGERSSARVVPTKSNPLQQNWFIPHDVAGLIELMEEPKSFHASRAKFTDGKWLRLNRILPIRLDSIPKTLNEAEPTCAYLSICNRLERQI